MKIEGDILIFDSGKKIYANNGIIGLGPDGTIYDGYDGVVHKVWNPETKELEDALSPEEKRKLAEYMIEQWSQFLEL